MRPRAVSPLLLGLLQADAGSGTPSRVAELLADLPAATTLLEAGGKRLVIELPPLDVPPADSAMESMIRTPVFRVDVPVSGAIHRYRVVLVDAAGDTLPRNVLHHVNLNDPGRRELFAPIMLHVLAASKETPVPSVPWLLFGLPIDSGDQYVLSGMLANVGPTPLRGVTLRLVLDLVPAGRPWPIWDAYPWVMDVKFPVGGDGGSKAFDLPPGRSSHSWTSSPAVPGTILGMGGHVHDYAVRVLLEDVTANATLWDVAPEREADGTVVRLPLGRFYGVFRLGKHIEPSHRYRVTVEYDNPTADTLREGGMGNVAGLFVPDDDAWPGVDPTDSTYLADLRNTLVHFGAGLNGMPGVRHSHRH